MTGVMLDALEANMLDILQDKYMIKHSYINWTGVDLPDLNETYQSFYNIIMAWVNTNSVSLSKCFGYWLKRHLQRVS